MCTRDGMNSHHYKDVMVSIKSDLRTNPRSSKAQKCYKGAHPQISQETSTSPLCLRKHGVPDHLCK